MYLHEPLEVIAIESFFLGGKVYSHRLELISLNAGKAVKYGMFKPINNLLCTMPSLIEAFGIGF